VNKVLLDGRKYNFDSRIRGKHQFTEEGNLIVTSSQQGRVLEINPKGNEVREFINKNPGNGEFDFAISQSFWLFSDFFNFEGDMACKS